MGDISLRERFLIQPVPTSAELTSPPKGRKHKHKKTYNMSSDSYSMEGDMKKQKVDIISDTISITKISSIF